MFLLSGCTAPARPICAPGGIEIQNIHKPGAFHWVNNDDID